MRTGFVKFSSICLFLSAVASGDSLTGQTLPNDTFFGKQWALHNTGQAIPIQVDATHTVEQTGKVGTDIGWEDVESLLPHSKTPVVVAVIDSGVDTSHPELQGKIMPDGKDFLTGAPMTDDVGHGTHVSGIIAAISGNSAGIVGVAPNTVKILPLRMFSAATSGYVYNGKLLSEIAADAVEYALDHGASVINMSMGWPAAVDTPVARLAFQKALARGVTIVAAAGNDHKETPTYPCSYAGVICVGAVSNDGSLTYFSNYGGSIDILAPGDAIVSTYPKQMESQILRVNGYEQMSGTSQAAPIVSGIIATLKAIYPSITSQEIKARIFASAGSPRDASMALFGIINLSRALEVPPSVVYLPRFKTIDSLMLDASSGEFSGTLPIDCFGTSCGEKPEVILSTQSAEGSVNSDSEITSQKLSTGVSPDFNGVSWNLHFSGKIKKRSSSDLIGISLQIASRKWSGNIRLARSASGMISKRIVRYPKNGLDLMVVRNGINYSQLFRIDDVANPSEEPEYYSASSPVRASYSVVSIIRPGQSPALAQVAVPSAESVAEVVKLDADLDGQPDYAVVCLEQHDLVNDLVVHFFKSDFTELYGEGKSSWRLNLLDPIGMLAEQSYGQIGSWIKGEFDGKPVLIPAFLAKGTLPAADNFGMFRLDHYATAAKHYYYLLPTVGGKGGVSLTPRALDSAEFYDHLVQQFSLSSTSDISLMAALNPSSEERSAGTVRILIGVGQNLDQKYYQIKASTTSVTDLSPLSSESGAYLKGDFASVLPATLSSVNLSTFTEYYDSVRGISQFINPQNGSIEGVEVHSLNPFSTFLGMIGFGSNESNKFALLNTRFDLVAIKKSSDGVATESAIPINRDSSFPSSRMGEMITPLMFSTQTGQTPMLGAYIDSTLMIGNTVGAAIWDQEGKFTRMARYSLRVPGDCVQLDPFVSTDQLLNYVILCDGGDHWEFRNLEP